MTEFKNNNFYKFEFNKSTLFKYIHDLWIYMLWEISPNKIDSAHDKIDFLENITKLIDHEIEDYSKLINDIMKYIYFKICNEKVDRTEIDDNYSKIIKSIFPLIEDFELKLLNDECVKNVITYLSNLDSKEYISLGDIMYIICKNICITEGGNCLDIYDLIDEMSYNNCFGFKFDDKDIIDEL